MQTANAGNLYGRDADHDRLMRAIGAPTDKLSAIVLSSASGLGKTSLLDAVCDSANAGGFLIARSSGRTVGRSVPCAPWLEALPQLAATCKPASEDEFVSVDVLGPALVHLLTRLSAEQPVLIALDDANSLDDSSIALLDYVTGMDPQTRVTLVIAEQSDAAELSDTYRNLVDGLLSRRIAHRLTLQPLSDDHIAELVAGVIGTLPHEVPAELVVRAQGNPWFARELATAYLEGSDEVPPSIAAFAATRLTRLDPVVQQMATAIAMSPDGASPELLELTTRQKPRELATSIDCLLASGLVREKSELFFIAHPLVQQALLAELSGAMKRAMHLELAALVGDLPLPESQALRLRGYHLARGGRSDEAVKSYVAAAELHDSLGNVHEAAHDYAAALDIEPRLERRVQLLKDCGFAASQIGSERSGEYWAELARISAANRDHDTHAYALVQQYWTNRDGTSTKRLERAAALGPESFGWSARAAAWLMTFEARYAEAVELDRRALELGRASGDLLLQTVALEKIGLSLSWMGQLDEAIATLREAVELATANHFHHWAVSARTTLADVLAENLETSRSLQECEQALRYVEDLQLVRYAAWVQAFAVIALARNGRLEEARELVDEALTARTDLPTDQASAILSCVGAHVANEIGDNRSEAACAEAIQSAGDQAFQSLLFEAQYEQSRHLANQGAVENAVALADGLDIDEPLSRANLALWMARLHARSPHSSMPASVERIRALLEPASPLLAVMLEEIDATTDACATGNVQQIVTVADRWDHVARPLDAARARVSAAVLMSGADSNRAIELFTLAREAFIACGAIAEADFVAGRLRALGTRSRAKSRVSQVGNLTKRELQIARLVASGLRNADVAGQLYLAEKTVAAHLSNIYGKLEVKSRVQLASWLSEHDVEQHPAVA